MICAFASSANAAPPDVSNIIASQRAGTKLVDITYDLVLDSGQTAFVELWFSPDNGLTFPVRCTAVSNDVNASVSPGTGKSVVWNAEADWDQQFTNNGKIRVIATYGNEASGFAGSGSGGGGGSGSGSGYGNLNAVPWNPYYEFQQGGGPGSGTWTNYAVPITDHGPDGTPGTGDDSTIDFAQDITWSTMTNIHADATEVTNAKWNEDATWGRNNGYTNWQDAPANDDNPRANVTFWDALRWCNARSEKEGLTPAYYMDSNEAVKDINQNGIYEAGEYYDSDGNGQYSPGLTTVFRAGANIPNYGRDVTVGVQPNQYYFRLYPIRRDANGYRLPSTATFFKLATGGNHQKKWPWGDDNPPGMGAPEFTDFAQYVRATSGSVNFTSASPATSRQPNGYGLKDVIGNLAEWAEDAFEWDDGTGNMSQTFPSLGGSYAGLGGLSAGGLWSLWGDSSSGTHTAPTIGLRCVRYEL